MNDKKMAVIPNSQGGFDLSIERDSGNPVLILMGNEKRSLPRWKALRDLCDEAIDDLESRPPELGNP